MSLEAAAKDLVECYKDLKMIQGTYGTICAYTLLNNKGNVIKHYPRAACHGYLKYVPPGCDILLTSMPQPNDLFYAFLKDVMFKQWSSHIHYEIEPTTGKHYIKITDLANMPANVLQNFCVASRSPFEIAHHLEKWEVMVAEGIHPTFAYMVCKHDDLSMPVTDVTKLFNHQHWPFEMTCSLERLVSGNPSEFSVSFKEAPAKCIPTNLIWGKDFKDLQGLNGFTISKFWAKWKAKHEDILLVS